MTALNAHKGNKMIDHKTKTIAIEWCVDDVLNVRDDLTEDQAWDVLQAVVSRHNAEIGINWEYIAAVADDLYPEDDEDDE
jgi:hypothetical protein